MNPLESSALVGRDREVRALEESVVAAAGGHGGAVFVTGGPGVGKSRLVAEAAAMARTLGLAVLRGRSPTLGPPPPWRTVAEALLSGLREVPQPDDPDLGPYAEPLGALLPGRGGPAQGPVPAVHVFEAVLHLLETLGRRSGLVLVLEDLHRADRETVDLVEYLAGLLHTAPVLCVATARLEPPTVVNHLVERLAAARDAQVLGLEPLTDAEVELLARTCLGGRDVPREVQALLRQRAGGLPLGVEELLGACLSAGSLIERDGRWVAVEPLRLHLPQSLLEIVRGRMERLDTSGRSVLEAAALAGPDVGAGPLGAITGLDEQQVLAALRRALDLGLVEVTGTGPGAVLTFSGPLTQEILLQGMLPQERARLGARCVEVLEAAAEGGADGVAERVGELCVELEQPARGARHLLRAGRAAGHRGDLASAEVLLRRARSLVEDPDPAALDADEALVEVLAAAGKAAPAVDLAASVARRLPAVSHGAARLAGAHLTIARAALASPDRALAETHLEAATALAELDAAGDVTLGAQCLAAELAIDQGAPEEALELATRVRTRAEDLGRPDVACRALELVARCLRAVDPVASEEAFREALALAEDHHLGLDALACVTELAVGHACATYEVEHLMEARERAEALGATARQASIDLALAWFHLLRFERYPARSAAERCLETAERYGLGTRGAALATLARHHALAGERSEMEAALAGAASFGGDPATMALIWEARAQLSAVDEERDRAGEELDRAAAALDGHEPAVPWWFTGARALLAAVEARDPGPPAAAARATRSSLASAWQRGYHAYARAVALGRQGPAEEATAAVAAGDRLLAGAPWCHQHARRLLAEAALAGGWGQPVSWLREALTFFELVGHDRMSRACKALLRQAGAPVPRRGRGSAEVPPRLRALGVTSREMDVACLVGAGLRNSEIAARLYLSPRTVKSHVASLLRKCGLSSRRQLVEVLARER